ncbi:OmpA family protein [uncultured Algibacter sp.]|uniref:OmpA family protein n=1 Tax=uncultured Algibacter sp. TaxID=298659 RepID=UPI002631E357|nr:OmpA family protein [uncultured Algibacter sp.]
MKLKNDIITSMLLLFTLCTFAQNDMQKKADNLFNNFAFVQATNAYHNLINDGINTDYATRQLADSYAYLRNPDSAVVYYEKAVKQSQVPIEYYYNYSQALRGVKDYEASRTWMKQFKNAGGNIQEQLYLKDSDFLNAIFNAKKQYTLKPVNFNSKFSDFGAYQHGDKIYFTSARDEGNLKKHLNSWDEEPFLNIYATNKDLKEPLVGNKSKLKGKVNSVYHDGPLTITKDGKTMYFSRTDFIKNILGKNGEGISNLKIYKASLIDGKWDNIQELPFNSNHFSNGHPALSADETKLYFASDRSGGKGGSDIYYVDIENGSYGKPKNLGSVVNTNKNEKFPFLNSEDVLFFSSDGHPGLGLLDIYGTVTNQSNNIVSVINLGTPVNSSKDDFSFFMNEDGLSGYFASNRKGGLGSDDIYAYDRTPQLNLEGTVYDDANNNPLNNAIVTLLDTDNKEIATIKTNNTGYYAINIDRNTAYQVKISKEGYVEKTDLVSSKNIEKHIKSINNDFSMKPIEIIKPVIETPNKIALSPIYFNFNSASVRNQDKQELDNIVNSMLNVYPEMVIKIESFSDSRGPANYNYKLSQKRATATYNYLINKGVNPNRIIDYKGYGENKLTNGCNSASKCTEAQHQSNRRTEFVIVKIK